VRILVANYRYFLSSGPERYLFNLKNRLEALGHVVMPYSIRYRQNEPSEYERYFASPLSRSDEVFFEQHSWNAGSVAKSLSRLFYSHEVERGIGEMVDETRPDVAYVLYYLRKLSPSLLVGIKKRNIPVVARISDFGLICAEHHMFRNNEPCTLCLEGSILNSVRKRCVKGSLAVSALDAVATAFHRHKRYFELIDRFVTTNEFMSDMMVRSGVSPNRIVCIPTFTDTTKFRAGEPAVPPYLLYVGRLDRPKGVHLLIEMMKLLRDQLGEALPELRIAGEGHVDAYVTELRDRVKELGLEPKIRFLGAVKDPEIAQLYRSAYLTLSPSLWFENLPNTVIESFASGCPVVGSNIGSLSSIISDGVNGLHHKPGDVEDLALAVTKLLTDRPLRDRLSKGARRSAEEQYSPQKHIDQLLGLFSELRAHGRPMESAG